MRNTKEPLMAATNYSLNHLFNPNVLSHCAINICSGIIKKQNHVCEKKARRDSKAVKLRTEIYRRMNQNFEAVDVLIIAEGSTDNSRVINAETFCDSSSSIMTLM